MTFPSGERAFYELYPPGRCLFAFRIIAGTCIYVQAASCDGSEAVAVDEFDGRLNGEKRDRYIGRGKKIETVVEVFEMNMRGKGSREERL